MGTQTAKAEEETLEVEDDGSGSFSPISFVPQVGTGSISGEDRNGYPEGETVLWNWDGWDAAGSVAETTRSDGTPVWRIKVRRAHPQTNPAPLVLFSNVVIQ